DYYCQVWDTYSPHVFF
nr:immunoglobulin light chain junction region [Macaca mulatta]MOW17550.1 immunoglobulin light chain junction region [Macaca mulatta]